MPDSETMVSPAPSPSVAWQLDTFPAAFKSISRSGGNSVLIFSLQCLHSRPPGKFKLFYTFTVSPGSSAADFFPNKSQSRSAGSLRPRMLPPRRGQLSEVQSAAHTGRLNANAVKCCLLLSAFSKNGEEIKHKNWLRQS